MGKPGVSWGQRRSRIVENAYRSGVELGRRGSAGGAGIDRIDVGRSFINWRFRAGVG